MPSGPRSTLSHDARLTLVTLGAAALRVESSPPSAADSAGAEHATGAGTGRPGNLFDLGKPLALITYLTCAPGRSVARDHLIDLLWGDVEPEAAKHALRQTLWYVRKRLGERQLIAGGDVLTIVGPVDCDRDGFLTAVHAGDPEAVVRHYTGDFFPGFAAPGGAEFERWADIERQRLQSLFCRSAETLARRWMSALKVRDAQALARRVRDIDPLREAGWRLLFETLIAAGDTVGGALEADAFDRLVGAEGVEPEPATRAMLRAVRQTPASDDAAGSEGRSSLMAELVGREQEFAELLASWESARAGRASHVHVLAPAGWGKTRLLTDVHGRLRATRARALFVRASLGARDIPFGLTGDLAEALARLPGASGVSTGSARALVALNPALSASYPNAGPDAIGDAADALRRRTLAVRELIAVVAEEQPIAIFIDDMQWADGRSRQLIAGVAGALERARVLLVTASRPMIDPMPSGDHSRTIRLTPLDDAGVGALVASIATLPYQPWAEHLAAELCEASGGSPLLVLETLQLALEGGMLARDEHGWSSRDPARLFAALQAGGALRQRVERLDRVERWVLTLLAVAAVPLSRDALAAAAGRSDAELSSALGSLERRGLAARQGEQWSPSHDEIAAMAVELATEDARRAAARSLGHVVLDAYPRDVRALRQAGGLLAQAGDSVSLAVAFARFAHLARQAGDHQPNRALAHDFLGERASEVLVPRLTRSLPLTHRLGLYSGKRQAVAAALMSLVPLGFLANAMIGRRPPPDAVLAIGTVGADSVASIYRVPIRAAQLIPGATIRVRTGGGPHWRFAADPSQGAMVRHPGGAAWIVDRVSDDAGGWDLYEVADDGRERRLTTSPGDDQGAAWSPDGRHLAFFTARWNARSRYDIAVQDVRTGSVRSLTRDEHTNSGLAWSPDGSRIAFRRSYWDWRTPQACVIDMDGRNERCLSGAAEGSSVIGAWYDATRIIVHGARAGGRMLGRLDVTSGSIDTVIALGPDDVAVISPDGRWVVCRCQRIGFSPDALLLFRVDEPNRAVELDVGDLPKGRRMFAFEWTQRPQGHAERLEIQTGVGNPIVGIPHLLTAIGITPDGDTVPAMSVRWRLLDTAFATLDSTGLLTPRMTGVVRVEVSTGGWRTTQRTVAIHARESRTLLNEDWLRGIGPPWRSYGDPKPSVDSSGGVRALLNNGDGNFTSGVYTVQRYPTGGGLTLDSWASAAVTRDQWQVTAIMVTDGLDDEGLDRWGHTSGVLPMRSTDWPQCGAGYPGREGVTYGDTLTAHTARSVRGVPAPSSFKRGVWFHVRIQIFPDSRCGVAVNGVPVMLSTGRAAPDSSVRIVTLGNSADTKVLIGPITLRTGVADDIDWSRIGDPVPDAPLPGFELRPGGPLVSRGPRRR